MGEGKFSWLGGFTPVGRENEVISKAKISEAIKHVTDQSARRRRQNQKKKVIIVLGPSCCTFIYRVVVRLSLRHVDSSGGGLGRRDAL